LLWKSIASGNKHVIGYFTPKVVVTPDAVNLGWIISIYKYLTPDLLCSDQGLFSLFDICLLMIYYVNMNCKIKTPTKVEKN
jgi:hypothetical protein